MRRLIHAIAIASLILPLGLTLPAAAQTSPLLPPVAPALTPTVPSAAFAPGVVLIGLTADHSAALSLASAPAAATSLQSVLAALGVQQLEPVFASSADPSSASLSPAVAAPLSRIYRLHLPAGADVLEAVAALQADPAVAYAEPDYLAHLITTTPNDPSYPDQWALAAVNASAAWDVVTGTTEVTIAVIDSGLDLDHPDLAAQLWINPGEIAANSLDDDNNGYVDDVYGANIYADNVDLTDTTGHGTQVAGILAAQTDNAEGVAGMCWQCRLMVVKVVQPGGIANYSDIAAGIAYAAQKGADVINLSLGGLTDSSTLRAAITAASVTAVVVAGAGNDDNDAPFYPAAYDAVLAVAGTTITDTKVGTSNYGAWVDLTAPGELITTTTDGGGYGLASGTSLAAPFVAGVAGLLRSLHPDWSPALVQAQILQTAQDIDGLNPGYAGLLGAGRLDAAAAVTTSPAPLVQYSDYAVNGVAHTTLGAGASVSLTVLLRNDWGPAAVVTGTLVSGSSQVTVTTATANWGAIASGATVANDSGPFHLTVGAGASGLTVPFTLTARVDGVPSVITFTATTAKQVVGVFGHISVDTLWTNDKIYNATNHVTVDAGVTLTIQAGTVVKFAAGKILIINGTLIADGTPAEPIRFKSNAANPAPGDWGGISFNQTSVAAEYDAEGNYSSGSLIRNAIIEYGKSLTLNAAPFIDHNVFRQNYPDYADHAVILVTTNTDDLRPPHISHNQIIGNATEVARHALSLFYRPALVMQNLFADTDLGLELFAATNVTIISNTITSNGSPLDWDDSTGAVTVAYWVPVAPGDFAGNNFYANRNPLDLDVTLSSGPFTATNNYWGSTDLPTIQARLSDLPSSPVIVEPFLTAPNPDAPAFLYQLSLDPASPVGIQTVTFMLTFSAPMDQSVDPTVTFGVNAPYTDVVVADNAQWLSATSWQATFDVTSLIAQDTYGLSVSGARGLDGLTIPTDTRFGFEVAYAGTITDQFPPQLAVVGATGQDANAAYVHAFWAAEDAGSAGAALQQSSTSAVTNYRYAIGSAPGATDIVNWTATPNAGVTRNIPGLIAGHTYWLSVQAQNAGGLWSAPGLASFVAGLQTLWQIYLPQAARP